MIHLEYIDPGSATAILSIISGMKRLTGYIFIGHGILQFIVITFESGKKPGMTSNLSGGG